MLYVHNVSQCKISYKKKKVAKLKALHVELYA
jgi:hypothetical protein